MARLPYLPASRPPLRWPRGVAIASPGSLHDVRTRPRALRGSHPYQTRANDTPCTGGKSSHNGHITVTLWSHRAQNGHMGCPRPGPYGSRQAAQGRDATERTPYSASARKQGIPRVPARQARGVRARVGAGHVGVDATRCGHGHAACAMIRRRSAGVGEAGVACDGQRESAAFGGFQRIGDGQELGERECKPWQQGRRIRVRLGHDQLCHRVRPTPVPRSSGAESGR